MNLWHSASPIIPNIQMRKLRLSDLAKVMKQINNHSSPLLFTPCVSAVSKGDQSSPPLSQPQQWTPRLWNVGLCGSKEAHVHVPELGWGSSHRAASLRLHPQPPEWRHPLIPAAPWKELGFPLLAQTSHPEVWDLGWDHLWCGDRKLPHVRAVGCDEGESLCQPLWETVLPPSRCSTLPFHVSASSIPFLRLWRGMHQEFGVFQECGYVYSV